MSKVEDLLASKFVCARCKQQRAIVQRLQLMRTWVSHLRKIQPWRYAFVSCANCGYTEVYNLETLEGRDDLGTFLDLLFVG